MRPVNQGQLLYFHSTPLTLALAQKQTFGVIPDEMMASEKSDVTNSVFKLVNESVTVQACHFFSGHFNNHHHKTFQTGQGITVLLTCLNQKICLQEAKVTVGKSKEVLMEL